MIKAVIFDMDGVIIDSEPVHLKLEQELFKELGLNIGEEEHITFVGSTSHYMWDNVRTKFNLSNTLEELVNKDRNKYLDYLNSSENLKPIQGIPELIKNLYKKDLSLAVASSSPINIIQIVVNNLKIDKYFKEIVSGDFVEKSKPNPDIFLYAAKNLGVDPKECVVIEDSSNGLKAAKNAGMKCVGYLNEGSGSQDLSSADLIIDSFNDIDFHKITQL